MLNEVKRNTAARRAHCIISVLLLVLSMCIIFAFSAQPGSPSEETSGGFVEKLLSVVYPGFEKKEVAERAELVDKYEDFVRETAHFVEFVPLGLFGYFSSALVTENRKKRLVITAVFGVLYACSDELHQYFVPGRSSQIIDIIIDSAGAAFGCLLGFILQKLTALRGKSTNIYR